MKKKETTLKQWYVAIKKERDKRLKLAEEHAKERLCDITETYQFTVAHGMTETLRIYEKVLEKNLKAENFNKDFTIEEVRELCIKYHRDFDAFYKFMNGQTVALNDKQETLYYGCDVEHFITCLGWWD